mmetsp:Transcript_107253/g.239461  ORF Transcript_107253/g.239461 Transcript_107253/m.239461 type:complete len:129 (-) Transcript_107253:33-419(-)
MAYDPKYSFRTAFILMVWAAVVHASNLPDENVVRKLRTNPNLAGGGGGGGGGGLSSTTIIVLVVASVLFFGPLIVAGVYYNYYYLPNQKAKEAKAFQIEEQCASTECANTEQKDAIAPDQIGCTMVGA